MKNGLCWVGLFMSCMYGCAHALPMPAVQERLPLVKTEEKAFSGVTRALAAAGFTIKTVQKDAGLIVTEPREFSIQRGLAKVSWPAAAEVQVLFVNSEARISITFKCGYSANVLDHKQFQICTSNDGEAQSAIASEKDKIVTAVRGGI